MKLQWKIALSVLLAGLVTAIFVNALLYSHLYDKNLAAAKQDARQTASLIRTALLNVMISTSGDYQEISRVIKDIQNEHFMTFRMVKSAHVMKQHGLRPGEEPQDSLEKEALASGRIIENMDSQFQLRIIYPFITDERCGQCHMGLNGEPVGIGVVNGAAVLGFDLAKQMEESESIIFFSMVALSLGALLFLLITLFVINRTLTKPIMIIAEAIKSLKNENFDIILPDVDTQEIKIVTDVVRDAAADLSRKMDDREKTITLERSRAMEIEKFVRGRASSLGLDVESEIPEIMGRLTTAVDEVKKKNLLNRAFAYVDEERRVISFPSDPDLIPAISAYLSNQVEAIIGPAKAGSLELTLDEALSNAVYHGNLDIPSQIKSEDFAGFYELARKRQREAPYSKRKVLVNFNYGREMLAVLVRDEGAGFDWKKLTSASAEASDLPHGRGLILMQALSSKLEFNEKGNEVTLFFNLDQARAAN